MSETLDARRFSLENSRILFDANVWILIFDFSAISVPDKMHIYSQAYANLLQKSNTIVVNDYVLGEFCNRCAKIAYELEKCQSADPENFPKFKIYRNSNEFRGTMESIRDTCLNIVDDHQFIGCCNDHYNIHDLLQEFGNGEADFSDIVLKEFCKAEKLYLMTDDGDFKNSGLNLISANPRLVGRRLTAR